jgi:uncharacterized membrane protein YkoI
MFAFFRRFLGESEKPVHSRLSREEAVAIARRAAANDPMSQDLSMAMVREQSGKVVWIVCSAAIGRTLEVTVDDASGDVLDVRRVGVR